MLQSITTKVLEENQHLLLFQWYAVYHNSWIVLELLPSKLAFHLHIECFSQACVQHSLFPTLRCASSWTPSGYSCKSCATGLQSLNCNYEITRVTCQTYQPHLSQALMVNIFHYLAHNITFLIIKTGSFRIQTNRALVVPMHIMKEQALQKCKWDSMPSKSPQMKDYFA